MAMRFGRITPKEERQFAFPKKASKRRPKSKAVNSVPPVANEVTLAQWEVVKALVAEAIRQASAAPARSAYTIEEFCKRLHISKRTYQKLRANGEGPAVTKIYGAVRISVQAELDFILRHEVQPTKKTDDAVK